jgi:hypothetical protein
MYATLPIVDAQDVITIVPTAPTDTIVADVLAETTPKPSERRRSKRRRRPDPIRVEMPDATVYIVTKVAEAESNAKLSKNRKAGWYTLGISMLPHGLGDYNVCPHASPACIAHCLNRSGRSMADTVQTDTMMRYRLAIKLAYMRHRDAFLAILRHDLENARKYAAKRGLRVCVRPNVYSDIDWARVHPDVIRDFPDVTFYGYTKRPDVMTRFMDGAYPSNCYLTFSRSELAENNTFARTVLARGYNVATIFDTVYSASSKHPLPASYWGVPIIDGDDTDLRFLDPRGVVVGLRAKGSLRREDARDCGFVVQTDRHPVNPSVID